MVMVVVMMVVVMVMVMVMMMSWDGDGECNNKDKAVLTQKLSFHSHPSCFLTSQRVRPSL